MIKLGAHQIQASAPASSSRTVSGYAVKSFMMMTLSFGLPVTLSGRLRRDSTTTEVMDGLFRHWRRVSEPIKPVVPLSITFIAQSSSGWRETNSLSQIGEIEVMGFSAELRMLLTASRAVCLYFTAYDQPWQAFGIASLPKDESQPMY
jgi:hypothetical protein